MSETTTDNWLEKLKPGDKVIVSGCYGNPGSVVTVHRTTNTQIIIKHRPDGADIKYRKNSGGIVGGDAWSRSLLERATKKAVNEIEDYQTRQKLRSIIHSTAFADLPTPDLQAIVDIIRKTVIAKADPA